MAKTVSHIHAKSYLKNILSKNPLALLGYLSTLLSTAKYRWVFGCVGRKTIVGGHTILMHPNNIRIGSNCLILDHVYIRTGLKGSVELGDYCAINSFAKIFAHGGVHVGDHAQIGPDCLITTTSHDYNKSLHTNFLPVHIDEWAWVGGKAILLPGITVGAHSVIGAGSVVTKNVPPYTLVAGNPARFIRRINQDKENV